VTALSTPTPGRAPPSLADVAIFLAGFGIIWTLFVIVVWKLGALPELARPWFRTALWLGAVLVWIAWQRPAAPLSWLGLSPLDRRSSAVTVAAFVILIAWNLLRVHAVGSSSTAPFLLTFSRLVQGLVGVFVEELVFRGVIQSRLSERLAAPYAVLLTAVLFLLIHLPGWIILSIPVGLGGVTTVFLVGVISGLLRLRTKSLWPGVAAHWANNIGAGF
jgi:membrane protease YdiL (CAAX protease family)